MFLRSVLFILFVGMLFTQCKDASTEGITPTGYNYNIKHSTGGPIAELGQFVYFEMDIIDNNGELLQSMRNLPDPQAAQIPLADSEQQANPILDVLSIMAAGDSLVLTIPIDSMGQNNPALAGLEYIQYDINAIEIVDKEEYNKRVEDFRKEQTAKAEQIKVREPEIADMVKETLGAYKSGSLKDIVTLPSGLEYFLHEKGEGSISVEGNPVTVHYYGVLKSDGSMFDNSFKVGRGYTFGLGRGEVIKGWDLGIAVLPKGSKATLFIPYDLAYGESGRSPIPAKADLVFYVEIED